MDGPSRPAETGYLNRHQPLVRTSSSGTRHESDNQTQTRRLVTGIFNFTDGDWRLSAHNLEDPANAGWRFHLTIRQAGRWRGDLAACWWTKLASAQCRSSPEEGNRGLLARRLLGAGEEIVAKFSGANRCIRTTQNLLFYQIYDTFKLETPVFVNTKSDNNGQINMDQGLRGRAPGLH